MMFTTKAEYGVRLLVELGRQSTDPDGAEGAPTSLKAIADAEMLPLAYLERIVAMLKKAGFVESTRGAHGGYRLTRDPAEIRMDEVIVALEGQITPMTCFVEETEADAGHRVVCHHNHTDGSACATKPAGKWNKVVLWIATGIVLLTTAFPSLSSVILRGTQSSVPGAVAGDNSVVLKVEIPSMDCAACAVSIQTKMRKLAGVITASVNYDTKEAEVQYDATKLAPEKIIAAIDETGFKAEPANK